MIVPDRTRLTGRLLFYSILIYLIYGSASRGFQWAVELAWLAHYPFLARRYSGCLLALFPNSLIYVVNARGNRGQPVPHCVPVDLSACHLSRNLSVFPANLLDSTRKPYL